MNILGSVIVNGIAYDDHEIAKLVGFDVGQYREVPRSASRQQAEWSLHQHTGWCYGGDQDFEESCIVVGQAVYDGTDGLAKMLTALESQL